MPIHNFLYIILLLDNRRLKYPASEIVPFFFHTISLICVNTLELYVGFIRDSY